MLMGICQFVLLLCLFLGAFSRYGLQVSAVDLLTMTNEVFNGTITASIQPTELHLPAKGISTLQLKLTASAPGLFLDRSGNVAFSPLDPSQLPFYIDLSQCQFQALNLTSMWLCEESIGREILNGTMFFLSWIDLHDANDQLPVIVPTASIPNLTLMVYSSVTQLPTDLSDNTTLLMGAEYTAFWAFMAGGQDGVLYSYDSHSQGTPLWMEYDTPGRGNASNGITAICYFSRNISLLAGGQDYLSGNYGDGFLLLQTNGNLTPVYNGSYAFTSVYCKTSLEETSVYYIAVGLNNTLLISADGLVWRTPSFPNYTQPILDFFSVTCVQAERCFAMGRREDGLKWQTIVLYSADGGETWSLRSAIPSIFGGPERSERGISLSCASGTTTCYLSTETYIGSQIRRSDDLCVTWTKFSHWDVLSEVKLDCFWADECIAGAGTWIGRWRFPAEIRITSDAGATWSTTYVGEIGEFIGSCKCGGRNNVLCICTSNRRMLIYSFENQTWSNITFPTILGPVASFQSYFAADLLYELYRALDGPNWLNHENWLHGNPCANNWFGVVCDRTDGDAINVVALRLPANGLRGQLPLTIGYLTGLQVLELEVNQLTGTIPSSINRLIFLKRLSFYNNQLSGSLPRKIGSCVSLQTMALFNNQLSGTLPVTLANLSALTGLYLHNNRLSGSLPETLGSLQALRWLNLRNNELSGTLPDAIGNISGLQALDLAQNYFQGAIPDSWASLNQLTHFDVSLNSLLSSRLTMRYPDDEL